MEERDLQKERLQAITEKHRIQENIRQKKLELDQEKVELHRLKKKLLREQWLLQDSAARPTQLQSLLCDQQQTRALQLNIHRTEMEVECLEREESMISINESFILNRLRTVEKSPEDIIKEAQDSFVPDQFQVATAIPDASPTLSSPRGSVQSETSLSTNTLFAMEINVSKNLLTGQRKVLSIANVPPEDIEWHAGLQVYDDGRKCVYAFTPEESDDQRSALELSASEVKELLSSAQLHQQVSRLNHQNVIGREEAEGVKGCGVREQRSHCSDFLIRGDSSCSDVQWADRRSHRPSSHSGQEDGKHRRKLSEPRGVHNGQGHRYGNQTDRPYSSFQGAACHGVNGPHTVSSRMNGSRPSGYPSPQSHDHRLVTANQQQLRYTPAQYIPYADYVSIDEGQLYCHNLVNQPHIYKRHRDSTSHRGSAHCERVPSPLCGDDTHFTILDAMDATEPITAVFMGFQTTLDDSGHFQEGERALKAELVVIDDDQGSWERAGLQEKQSLGQAATAGLANGKAARSRRGPGIRKFQKKHKACCSVC